MHLLFPLLSLGLQDSHLLPLLWPALHVIREQHSNVWRIHGPTGKSSRKCPLKMERMDRKALVFTSIDEVSSYTPAGTKLKQLYDLS